MTWEVLLALALAAPPAPLASAAAEIPIAEIVTGPEGYVRVTEIGHPPLGMGGPRARAIARENARARARERLLKAILAYRLASGRRVEQALRERPEFKNALRGVLNAASASGVELAGDAVELTLTVRMGGEDGLGRFLDALTTP